MKRVLLSAFACDPTKGSESSVGWNWAIGLAEKGFDVHCLTRETSRAGISTEILPRNLTMHYVRLPLKMEKLYAANEYSVDVYYILWQWKAYRIAARLHKENAFDIAHHVSWGSLQMGSFMYRLKIPFVFGPAGGGQTAPAAFKRYFGAAWATEENRDRASRLLLKFNPSCRSMLEKATAVLASNGDTARIAKANGGSNISLALDAGLPRWFFRETNVAKLPQADTLKLLWVGRFMPRKGTLLLLDTMKALNEYPGITLTLVGDGPTRDEFLDTVKTYQLEDTVHWKGRVPWGEVRGYYADHDVFLFTSL